MRSAVAGRDGQQRCSAVSRSRDTLEVRDGRLGRRGDIANLAHNANVGMAFDRGVNGKGWQDATFQFRRAEYVNYAKVLFGDAPVAERLRNKSAVLLGLQEYDNAGGVHVKAMAHVSIILTKVSDNSIEKSSAFRTPGKKKKSSITNVRTYVSHNPKPNEHTWCGGKKADEQTHLGSDE